MAKTKKQSQTPAATRARERRAAAKSGAAGTAATPGTPDPQDGPAVGRVDPRGDALDTQPRPARPLVAPSAEIERIAPAPPPAGEIDEDPLRVDKGFPKKVRAIRMGYYRHARRRAGDVFMIYNAQEFSPRWMEYAGARDAEKITTGQQELERQRRESIEDRMAKKRAGTGDADVLGATA